jgi:hypothetical protein
MAKKRTVGPQPNTDDFLRGTCTICLQPCDTALAFKGSFEWAVAGLLVLGIQTPAESVRLVSYCMGSDPNYPPDGTITVQLKCCQSCAANAHLRVGLVASGTIPGLVQKPQLSLGL